MDFSLSSSVSPVVPSNVTNHWVVLVSTSRYWFNYRHAANALSLYRIVKRAGIPDSRILLLLPDDFACQSRNGEWAGQIFNSAQHSLNLYEEDDVEVDYRGADVTVESFLRLLTGRHEANVVKSQRLQSDSHSAVLIYLSGHGGDGFLKFQDSEELSAVDLSSALHAMAVQGRYSSLLLLLDTCQAESMASTVTSPSVLSIASSRVGQNSYSHSVDHSIGLSLIDRFTAAVLDFFEGGGGGKVVGQLLQSLDPSLLLSDPVTRLDLFPLPPSQVPVSLFFSAEHRPLTQRGGGQRYHRRQRANDSREALQRETGKEEKGKEGEVSDAVAVSDGSVPSPTDWWSALLTTHPFLAPLCLLTLFTTSWLLPTTKREGRAGHTAGRKEEGVLLRDGR